MTKHSTPTVPHLPSFLLLTHKITLNERIFQIIKVIITNAMNDWETSRDFLQTLLPKVEKVVGEIQYVRDYFEGDNI
jgi:hypothetical protein